MIAGAKRKSDKLLRWLALFVVASVVMALGAAGVALYGFWYFGRSLPDHKQLADYEPPVMSRVYAGDGRLLVEYAIERRVFVPVEAIPRRVVNAFIAAEDQHFYTHPGVDPVGILRAAITNVRNFGTGRRPVGASTITQQVAQNFFVSKEVSIRRKAREAILALRMERAFTKDRILELYLNEIYLGFGSYGVAAAALNYFNKALHELTIAEAAFLAALPKAPNNYHPIRRPAAARARRDYVIGRMLEEAFISPSEAELAKADFVRVRPREATEIAVADYFAEEVRRELAGRYGEDALYEGGLSVRTTLDPRLQRIADRALRTGLRAYDIRHGWRGPVTRMDVAIDWPSRLSEIKPPPGIGDWRMAVVLELTSDWVDIGFADGVRGIIPFAEMKWARAWQEGQKRGPAIRQPADALGIGDVVMAEPVQEDGDGVPYPENSFGLRQIPAVSGAIVALDPHTGRVLAMSGGYSFRASQFNRATQAKRQPGSAFKPFVYMAALDSGFTPSTLVLDAPFVIDQGAGLGKWKPANYSNRFYGPAPMRLGVERSRNLMTVRLAQTVGMDRVKAYAERFGVVDNLPEQLSMALGAGETTLMRLSTAYAMIVNGGRRVVPTLIDRVQDRYGRTVFRHDTRACDACQAAEWTGQAPPRQPDRREQVVAADTAYQMVSMLQGVVQRGTGRRVREIGKPLAGKTGTTNDSNDAWFIGFTPDLVVGVYAGFDVPRPLGDRETGSSVAAPIFKSFMTEALADQPAIPFRIPKGILLVRVNAETGLPVRPGDTKVLLEAFKPGTVPTELGPLIGANDAEGLGLPTVRGGRY